MKKTMTTNAEWLIKQGYKFRDLLVREAEKGKHGYRIFITTSDGTCKKIGETEHVYNNRLTSVILWLDEDHKEPILDDAEKRYLSAVIRPFRESVICISKSDIYRDEAICIDTKYRYMVFPPFKAGTMYKGMKVDWKYTLEELGL